MAVGSQLPFDLQPLSPHSLEYFVPHSGVMHAVQTLYEAVEALSQDSSHFFLGYLHGPSGVGKTHLGQGIVLRAVELGIAKESLLVVELDQVKREHEGCISEDWIRKFISEVEYRRSHGGLVILLSCHSPHEITDNPHLESRLLCGSVQQLVFPMEDELKPLVLSLLERKNLRLPDAALEYLFKRVRVDPLSFDAIFARINEISLATGRPARLGVIREAVQEVNNKRN